MKIPTEIIEEVLNRVSMEDIVSEYVKLEHRGNNIVGCCPFHKEKTPSFSITPEKNLFYCFGCHESGNIFHFIQKIENLSFVDSVKLLAEKTGVELNLKKSIKKVDKEYEEYLKLYKYVDEIFRNNLFNSAYSQKVYKYLYGRGFTDEIIKEFGIGFSLPARNHLYNHLLEEKYSKEFLSRSGLFSKKYENITLFSNRIMFPIKDRKGNVIAFGGRIFSGEGPKYINTGETKYYKKKNNFYSCSLAIPEIRKSGFFYIVEGYMDVIAFYRVGIKNVIAPLGTAFTTEQASILSRYAKKAVAVFDGDKAGKNAAIKSVYTLEENEIESKVVLMPENKDPDDLVNESPNLLKKVLKEKEYGLNFIMKELANVYNVNTLNGKESFILKIFDFINLLKSEIKQAIALQKLAEYVNIKEDIITANYKSTQKGNKTIALKDAKPKPKPKNSNSDYNILMSDIEFYTLVAVFKNPELFKEMRKYIRCNDLKNPIAIDMYIAFEECYRKGNMNIFSIELENEPLLNFLNEKVSSGIFDNISSNMFYEEFIKKVKIKILQQKIDKVQHKIKETSNIDYDKIIELIRDKQNLENKLKDLK